MKGSQCLLGILSAILNLSVALPKFDSEHIEHVESIVVKHERTVHSRISKRSTNQGPEEVHFSFTSQDQPINLRLRRHSHSQLQIPVFTLRNGSLLEHTVSEQPRVGFYHDDNFGAAFILSRSNRTSNPFDLEGAMMINGVEYIMTPEQVFRSVDGSEATHALKRLSKKLNFGTDGIDERDPYTRYLSRQREATRRSSRQNGGSLHGFFWTGKKKKRRKRQAYIQQTHYVELSMIADFRVWEKFLQYANKDPDAAFRELRSYYMFVSVMMDIRYKSVTDIDSSLRIRILPVSLIVTDLREEAIWTEPNRVGLSFVNAVPSLYTLRDWVKRGVGVPKADHTMLFTGFDLLGRGSDSSTIGVAFIGTACTYNSVSLIEEYFTATSGSVSAHELGHSLDAEHDINYQYCSDRSSNVMSTQAVFPTDPTSVSNPWKFSHCSVDAFGAFLTYSSNCTRNRPAEFISTEERGGEHFNADDQCKIAMGPRSYFCRTVQSRKGYTDMCRHLYCYLPEDPGFCGSIIAAEFTVCGDRKSCQFGKCVRDEASPSVSDTCPQGDEPGYECNHQNCLTSDSKVRDVLCCDTCNRNKTTDLSPLGKTEKNQAAPSTSTIPPTTTASIITVSTTRTPQPHRELTTTTVSSTATYRTPTSKPVIKSTTDSATFVTPENSIITSFLTTASSPSTTTTTTSIVVTLMENERDLVTPSSPSPTSAATATTPKAIVTTTLPAVTLQPINTTSSLRTTAEPPSSSTAGIIPTTSMTLPPVTLADSINLSSLRTTTSTDLEITTATIYTNSSPSSPLATSTSRVTATSASTTTTANPDIELKSTTATPRSPTHMTKLPSKLTSLSTSAIRPTTKSTTTTSTTIATTQPKETSTIKSATTTDVLIPQPTTTRPTTTTTTTLTTTTTTPATKTVQPTPPSPLPPCADIICLCQRCFYCYVNLCRLFSPGGFYYTYLLGR